ncbi:hypothetical protein ACSBR1_006042 [Camellia fascicularis]
MSVNTYNISSYSSIVQSKITFEVPKKNAKYSGETMKIVATLTLSANSLSTNQSNSTTLSGTTRSAEFLMLSLTSGNTTLRGSGGSSGANSGVISMIENKNFAFFVICFVSSFVFKRVKFLYDIWVWS